MSKLLQLIPHIPEPGCHRPATSTMQWCFCGCAPRYRPYYHAAVTLWHTPPRYQIARDPLNPKFPDLDRRRPARHTAAAKSKINSALATMASAAIPPWTSGSTRILTLSGMSQLDLETPQRPGSRTGSERTPCTEQMGVYGCVGSDTWDSERGASDSFCVTGTSDV